jgi:hypothetical protein
MFIGEINKESPLIKKVEFFTYILTSDILSDSDVQHKFFNLLYMITEGEPYLDFNANYCVLNNKEELLTIKSFLIENDSLGFCSRHIIANYLAGISNFNNKQCFRTNDIHTAYSILLNYLSLQHVSKLFNSIHRPDLYCVCEKLLNNNIGGFDLAAFNNMTKNTNTYAVSPEYYFNEVGSRLKLI